MSANMTTNKITQGTQPRKTAIKKIELTIELNNDERRLKLFTDPIAAMLLLKWSREIDHEEVLNCVVKQFK